MNDTSCPSTILLRSFVFVCVCFFFLLCMHFPMLPTEKDTTMTFGALVNHGAPMTCEMFRMKSSALFLQRLLLEGRSLTNRTCTDNNRYFLRIGGTVNSRSGFSVF